MEETPNPRSFKFILPQNVGLRDSRDFTGPSEESPLTKEAFQIPGVERLFLTPKFITVTLSEDTTTPTLSVDQVKKIIDRYLAENEDLVKDDHMNQDPWPEADDEVVEDIKNVLEKYIRPIVMEDGGNVVFHSFDRETGLLRVKLQGSCSGCPLSSETLRGGIENMVHYYVPEVTRVEEARDILDEVSDQQLRRLEESL